MPSRLGKVVATRQLRTADRERRKVIVRLGQPRREPDGSWICPFQITGLGRLRVNAGHGVDAFQAIHNALEGIRIMLEEGRRKLTWGDIGHHGFPRYVLPWFGKVFEQRITTIFDREVIRFVRKLERRYKSGARRPKRSKGV